MVSPVDDMAGDKVAAPVLSTAPVEDEVVVAFVTNRAVLFRWGPLGSAGVHWGPLGSTGVGAKAFTISVQAEYEVTWKNE